MADQDEYYCFNCGEDITQANANFCPSCGVDLFSIAKPRESKSKKRRLRISGKSKGSGTGCLGWVIYMGFAVGFLLLIWHGLGMKEIALALSPLVLIIIPMIFGSLWDSGSGKD